MGSRRPVAGKLRDSESGENLDLDHRAGLACTRHHDVDLVRRVHRDLALNPNLATWLAQVK
jgi:hypothetical protein